MKLPAALLVPAVLPLLGPPPYYLYLLSMAYLLAALATAWTLLAHGGQVSFGHAAFFGLGAYGAALTSLHGASPWLAIALGGALAAVGGAAVGLGAGRLGGAALALATFAAAELLRGVALNWTSLTGGGAGLIGIPPVPPLGGIRLDFARGRAAGYYLALAVLGAALGLSAATAGSRAGLALAALREGEARATLLGVRPLPWKVLAFVLSALVTGLAGAVYAHMLGAVEPDVVFGPFFSIAPLVIATLGGRRTLLGPAVAAVALELVSELVFHPLAPALHQLPYALALIAVTLVLPPRWRVP
jgi:branched-chain amino acid transport system permease protein